MAWHGKAGPVCLIKISCWTVANLEKQKPFMVWTLICSSEKQQLDTFRMIARWKSFPVHSQETFATKHANTGRLYSFVKSLDYFALQRWKFVQNSKWHGRKHKEQLLQIIGGLHLTQTNGIKWKKSKQNKIQKHKPCFPWIHRQNRKPKIQTRHQPTAQARSYIYYTVRTKETFLRYHRRETVEHQQEQAGDSTIKRSVKKKITNKTTTTITNTSACLTALNAKSISTWFCENWK